MNFDSREIQRYVVRVDDVEFGPLGTAFFIAPGWLLTCAHVAARVKDRSARLYLPHSQESISANVLDYWPDIEGTDEQSLWPFPDVGLISVPELDENPCVYVSHADPISGEVCYSWGYPSHFESVGPAGSPASFEYEGVDGIGRFQLKAGQAQHGLSGSPLISPARRAVVGIVSISRSADAPYGGWATPISQIMQTLDKERRGRIEGLLQMNQRAHTIDRLWNRVLPIVDSHRTVDISWTTFKRSQRSQPTDLLRPNFSLVPYLFRDDALLRVEAWCGSTETMSVWSIAASGGFGKTRFGIQACTEMVKKGWLAGFVSRTKPYAVVDVPLPRLIVVDYAENSDPIVVGQLISLLGKSATREAPVRILILTRTGEIAKGIFDRLSLDVDAQMAVDARFDEAYPTDDLDVGQRLALYRSAATKFAGAWGVANYKPSDVNLSDRKYSNPLDVLLAALDDVLSVDDPLGIAHSSAMERVLRHEEKYWSSSPDLPATVDSASLRLCVALATLAGADSEEEAVELLECSLLFGDSEGGVKSYARWLKRLYRGSRGYLNPLEPDRLGEALVADVVISDDVDGVELLRSVLHLGGGRSLRAISVVGRMCGNRAEVDIVALEGLTRFVLDCSRNDGNFDPVGKATPNIAHLGVGFWTEVAQVLIGPLNRFFGDVSTSPSDLSSVFLFIARKLEGEDEFSDQVAALRSRASGILHERKDQELVVDFGALQAARSSAIKDVSQRSIDVDRSIESVDQYDVANIRLYSQGLTTGTHLER